MQSGNVWRRLHHLHNGPEQQERDAKMWMVLTGAGEFLSWNDPELAPCLLGYEGLDDVEAYWPNGGKGREMVRGRLVRICR